MLKNNRKGALEQIQKDLSKLGKTATKSECEKIKRKYLHRNDNNELMPYCGVPISYLEKRLSKLS